MSCESKRCCVFLFKKCLSGLELPPIGPEFFMQIPGASFFMTSETSRILPFEAFTSRTDGASTEQGTTLSCVKTPGLTARY